MRQSAFGRAVQRERGGAARQRLEEPAAQRSHLLLGLLQPADRGVESRSQADGESDRLSPGPPAALLMAAEYQWLQSRTAGHEQNADSQRSAKLVPADAERGHA